MDKLKDAQKSGGDQRFMQAICAPLSPSFFLSFFLIFPSSLFSLPLQVRYPDLSYVTARVFLPPLVSGHDDDSLPIYTLVKTTLSAPQLRNEVTVVRMVIEIHDRKR